MYYSSVYYQFRLVPHSSFDPSKPLLSKNYDCVTNRLSTTSSIEAKVNYLYSTIFILLHYLLSPTMCFYLLCYIYR